MNRAKSFFDWGLDLPEKAVQRRVSRRFNVSGKEPLANLAGPGCIKRLWVTGENIGRELILRITFDGATVPHVEAPMSDFFGVMHNLSERHSPYWERNKERAAYTINTPFLASKPHNGFTCYFPMPFAESARIEVENDSGRSSRLFCIIDWHAYPEAALAERMRFCARWRREAPARDCQDGFLILDAEGPGRLAGFVHSIDMLHDRDRMRWSHAGSDNIYLDGRGSYPAFLRGIGGEDTFGTSYGGHTYRPQSALFSDMPYYVQKNTGNDKRQKLVGYRFFAQDAVCFDRSIHFRFGTRAHDLAATVYWYSAAPVRPCSKIPPYTDRLPGSRPRRKYDLPLGNSGRWWITGPFPDTFKAPVPTEMKMDPTLPFHNRLWRLQEAKGGFVEFNHVFLSAPSNNLSPTLVNALAFARCRIEAPEETWALFTFGWDDRLSYRLNEDPEVGLGEHEMFDSHSVRVLLRKGVNELGVKLSNTTGFCEGGWCFSFGAVTEDGVELTPRMECPSIQSDYEGCLLGVNFSAGTPCKQKGYLPFVPPYSDDLSGSKPCETIDLVGSPQTFVFPTASGLVEVTASASDNTGLGFRLRSPVREGPFMDLSELLRGEVRANPDPEDGCVRLELTLTGLPEGEYLATSTHHCLEEEVALSRLTVLVNGRSVLGDAVEQTSGINPEPLSQVTFPVCVAEDGSPVFIAFEAVGTVVLNGLEIHRTAADNHR